ncbi:MAG: hypothetical protein LUQ50_07735 [Methanospirillum sp.]|nr:hypothetical protein [Methanospirillum sp.]
MSLESRQVINANGLHVSVTGESGKGKSHAFETMMNQVPEESRLEGRMSEKALFYIKGMQPESVISLDDVALSDLGHCGTAECCGLIAENSATNSGTNCESNHELNNNNIILCTYCGIRENTESKKDDHEQVRVCSSDGCNSATSDHEPQSGDTLLSDCKNEADSHCPKIRNKSATPHIEHGFIENSATPCDESSGSWKVRTSEFCKIERGFGTGPCDCCGMQWVHYQERMTDQRLAAHPRKT